MVPGRAAELSGKLAQPWDGCLFLHHRGTISRMALAQSKLTAQGQISVPVEVRRRLGLSPGSILEWEEHGDEVIVRRAGLYTSEDLHRALFPTPPKPLSLEEMKEGIREYVKRRHARR